MVILHELRKKVGTTPADRGLFPTSLRRFAVKSARSLRTMEALDHAPHFPSAFSVCRHSAFTYACVLRDSARANGAAGRAIARKLRCRRRL